MLELADRQEALRNDQLVNDRQVATIARRTCSWLGFKELRGDWTAFTKVETNKLGASLFSRNPAPLKHNCGPVLGGKEFCNETGGHISWIYFWTGKGISDIENNYCFSDIPH